jgi:hypothetical protein
VLQSNPSFIHPMTAWHCSTKPVTAVINQWLSRPDQNHSSLARPVLAPLRIEHHAFVEIDNQITSRVQGTLLPSPSPKNPPPNLSRTLQVRPSPRLRAVVIHLGRSAHDGPHARAGESGIPKGREGKAP